MRQYAVVLLAILAICLVAPAAFAQTTSAEPAQTGANWVAITAGFSMAIAAAGCGYAQAKASAAASEGMARNPGASGTIQNMLILALVLIESMSLYVFAIIYLKVK
ncbi:MAG TPA: ATP synthase F0 subunit C [Candidatus Dormibacteraeota bacterium]|nr:ATP synthase F0 subunit C [Candidatus Dormibacteraeota bacterium]